MELQKPHTLPDAPTLIEQPILLCGEAAAPDYKCDLDPHDPREAAALVTDFRVDILAANIFTEIADTSPNPAKAAIAQEAAGIAQQRYGMRMAVYSAGAVMDAVPATVQLDPNPENALFAFDEKLTAHCRQRELNKRLAAACVKTGEMEAIEVPQQPESLPGGQHGRTLRTVFSGLLKYLTFKKTAPVSYYERSVQARAVLQADIAACEASNLPAHTATELTLLKGALEARVPGMQGVDKVEHQALLTRLNNGEVPVTHSLVNMVRQRGASALIRLLAGEPLTLETSGAHSSFLIAIQ